MIEPYKCSTCGKKMILWDMNYCTVCDDCKAEMNKKKIVCENCKKEVDSLHRVIPKNKILYKDDYYMLCNDCKEVI